MTIKELEKKAKTFEHNINEHNNNIKEVQDEIQILEAVVQEQLTPSYMYAYA